MSNSSGIPDYLMLEGAGSWYTQPATPAELIDRFRRLPLLFAPGSRLSYSNSNWVLLTAILESVSAESYGAYLRRHVLDPLGMAHTAHEEGGAVAPLPIQRATYRRGMKSGEGASRCDERCAARPHARQTQKGRL